MKECGDIATIHLFPVLDRMLITLLSGLTGEEWNTQTVARLWKVKDVAAHLLDGNLRGLSASRDRYFGDTAENIGSYQDLVRYINGLNMSWTDTARRLSPEIITWLLELSGKEYTEHLQSLDPFADAIYPVAWAGQDRSPNWFHIAREYTEKFLHQQQIRDAVGKPGLLTGELFYPFIDTLMYAFPHTFRDVAADDGTTVSIIVTTDAGGRWNITKGHPGWTLSKEPGIQAHAVLTIDPDTAWKLFSKSLSPAEIVNNVEIEGDRELGAHALKMVSVMA